MPSKHPLQGAELSVPGSIGNVGAGFDTLAVAVQLYLRVRVRAVDERRRGSLEFEFVDGAPDGENMIERAFRRLAPDEGVRLPGLTIEVRSDIPMQAGLGSSAAAVVAGVKLCEALTRPRSVEDLLTVAARVEGHPDNAAASLMGGLTACCERANGTITAFSSRWPEWVSLIVATPAARLKTSIARRVLPETVPLADAIFNLQRVPLLLHALQRGEYAEVKEALRDRWHQPFRQALVPGLERLLTLEHPDLLGVCLSGAGPSVAALAARNAAAIERLLLETYAGLGIACQVRTLSADRSGSVWHRAAEVTKLRADHRDYTAKGTQ